MLTIFKNCPVNTCILDDFMYYEERQRMMQAEKSMLLGRRTPETSIYPVISVPSIKPIGAFNHLPNGDEQQLSHGVDQPPITNGKETNVKASHCLESDGRKAIPNTTDQDMKTDNKQKDVEVSLLPSHEGQLNGTLNQLSKSDAHSSGDANPAAEPDGKQIKHRSKQSVETKNDQGKYQSIPIAANKSSPDHGHPTLRHSAADSKDKRNIRPESKGGSNGQNSSSGIFNSLPAGNKIDDPDVLTVGSMQIEITNTNSSISGTLTIGSIPIDTKELKS